MTPRQSITSALYAIKSLNAASVDTLSSNCVLCVTDAHIQTIDGSKITGTVSSAASATSATTALNVTGVVQVANGGTGSTTKNFVDLSTNQLSIGGNKTFTGTVGVAGGSGVFKGDGSALLNVPGTVPWQVVTTSQQAQANRSYVANSGAQVTITLPGAANTGDIIRVFGAGTGAWKITQNAGQSILANPASLGVDWTPRESNRFWASLASSADGSKLVAVDSSGEFGGQIYTSTDSGVSWTPRDSVREWQSLASSGDGIKLVAVVGVGRIYTSTDSGVSWTPRESNRDWQSVACSADGIKLVAVAANGRIHTSTDSGVSWTPRENLRNWASVASSADGVKLIAVEDSGRIYTSTDSGATWTPRESNRFWQSVASSTDGSKVIAVNSGGQIYTSTDSGLIWTPREGNRQWQSVASSTDGSKVVAAVAGGQIYTATLTAGSTTVGTAGYLAGGNLAAIELIYIGNGKFFLLSHEGAITIF